MRRLSTTAVRYVVRPTFMVPAVGTSLSGGALAPSIDGLAALVHAVAVALVLLVAHLRDGHVDGHVRGEETPVLSAAAFRAGTVLGTAAFLASCLVLWLVAGPVATLLTLPLLVLALLHAPYLDVHPLTVTVDYPVGIGLILLGGYATQTDSVAPAIFALATVVASSLAGIKVTIDRLDIDFDRTIGKRTIPVVLGVTRANAVAAATFVATLVLVVAFVFTGILPVRTLWASPVPLACALALAAPTPRTTVRIQMALTYLFVAMLFLAVCAGWCSGWLLVERLVERAGGVIAAAGQW